VTHLLLWRFVSPDDIVSAKKIGRLLRSAREAQKANLQRISNQCGLQMTQLIHLENGNIFIFDRSLERFTDHSLIYAQALGVEASALLESLPFMPAKDIIALEPKPIPAFLKKK
jgi:transcriptional regulator with XRE-family HTH domain